FFMTISYCNLIPYYLHSFPTRRSSDLPCSIGFTKYEVATVLSTNKGTLLALATLEMALISNTSNFGFPKDSIKITRVFSFTALRSEEHTSELQSRENLVCRLLLEKKNK